jgi:hypothetical protein
VEHLVVVTAELEQPSRGRQRPGRLTVDDLGRDDLVDRQVQPRVHALTADRDFAAPLADRIVELGMRQTDQHGTLVGILGIEQA